MSPYARPQPHCIVCQTRASPYVGPERVQGHRGVGRPKGSNCFVRVDLVGEAHSDHARADDARGFQHRGTRAVAVQHAVARGTRGLWGQHRGSASAVGRGRWQTAGNSHTWNMVCVAGVVDARVASDTMEYSHSKDGHRKHHSNTPPQNVYQISTTYAHAHAPTCTRAGSRSNAMYERGTVSGREAIGLSSMAASI